MPLLFFSLSLSILRYLVVIPFVRSFKNPYQILALCLMSLLFLFCCIVLYIRCPSLKEKEEEITLRCERRENCFHQVCLPVWNWASFTGLIAYLAFPSALVLLSSPSSRFPLFLSLALS